MKALTIALPLFAATLVGCQTNNPEYLVTVSNQGTAPVQDVQVGYAGEIRGSAALVEPGTERGQLHPGAELGDDLLVRWKDSQGQAHEVTLAPDNPLHAPFTGEFYIQFKDDGQARLYVMHERERNVTLLPWGQPAQWEQAPNIPGLDGQ